MAAFVLGLLILGAFLSFLVLNNLSDRLFDPETYTDALLEGNAYQRLHSEVLPRYRFETLVREPLKETPFAVHADLADTLLLWLELMRPEYLQGQVESNIERSAAYFTQETDRLELYLELEEPPANLESAIPDSVERRIDATDINDVVDQLVGLEPGSGSLQIDQADYSRELTEFLNLIALFARWSEGVTETELRRKIEGFRVDINRVLTQGQIWSLGIVALGTIAIGALYLPNWGRGLRQAGLALLLTGLVALVAGWLAEAILPGLLSRQGGLILTHEFGLPPEAVSLASDVFRLVLARQLEGIFLPALAPILVGAILLSTTAAHPPKWNFQPVG